MRKHTNLRVKQSPVPVESAVPNLPASKTVNLFALDGKNTSVYSLLHKKETTVECTMQNVMTILDMYNKETMSAENFSFWDICEYYHVYPHLAHPEDDTAVKLKEENEIKQYQIDILNNITTIQERLLTGEPIKTAIRTRRKPQRATAKKSSSILDSLSTEALLQIAPETVEVATQTNLGEEDEEDQAGAFDSLFDDGLAGLYRTASMAITNPTNHKNGGGSSKQPAQQAANNNSMSFANSNQPSTMSLRKSKSIAPVGEVTIVFTDIQSSSFLWNMVPNVTRKALTLHNECLRGLISHHMGYEVKTQGDSFMVCFAHCIDAVRWAVNVQLDLLEVDWPQELLQFDGDTNLVVSKHESTAGAILWNGLRVKCGMHHGNALALTDTKTGRMDYFGPHVNRAARVASKSQGGQILMSKVAYGIATAAVKTTDTDLEDTIEFRMVGQMELKGFAPTTQDMVYQLFVKALDGRDFRSEHTGLSIPMPIEPLDYELPSCHGSVVFMEVEGAIGLWNSCTSAMRKAVIIHQRFVRSQLRRFQGYEVNVEGDRFCVVFKSATEALAFSLQIQHALTQLKWPPELLSDPLCKPRMVPAYNGTAYINEFKWRGLRVRMGINHGRLLSALDSYTGAPDFFGPTVNKALLICSTAFGGEILCSSGAKARAQILLERSGQTTSIGKLYLPGFDGKVELFSIVPLKGGTSQRSFVRDTNSNSGSMTCSGGGGSQQMVVRSEALGTFAVTLASPEQLSMFETMTQKDKELQQQQGITDEASFPTEAFDITAGFPTVALPLYVEDEANSEHFQRTTSSALDSTSESVVLTDTEDDVTDSNTTTTNYDYPEERREELGGNDGNRSPQLERKETVRFAPQSTVIPPKSPVIGSQHQRRRVPSARNNSKLLQKRVMNSFRGRHKDTRMGIGNRSSEYNTLAVVYNKLAIKQHQDRAQAITMLRRWENLLMSREDHTTREVGGDLVSENILAMEHSLGYNEHGKKDFIVVFGDQKKILSLRVPYLTLHDLRARIGEEFGLPSTPLVEFFDKAFEAWVVARKIEDIEHSTMLRVSLGQVSLLEDLISAQVQQASTKKVPLMQIRAVSPDTLNRRQSSCNISPTSPSPAAIADKVADDVFDMVSSVSSSESSDVSEEDKPKTRDPTNSSKLKIRSKKRIHVNLKRKMSYSDIKGMDSALSVNTKTKLEQSSELAIVHAKLTRFVKCLQEYHTAMLSSNPNKKQLQATFVRSWFLEVGISLTGKPMSDKKVDAFTEDKQLSAFKNWIVRALRDEDVVKASKQGVPIEAKDLRKSIFCLLCKLFDDTHIFAEKVRKIANKVQQQPVPPQMPSPNPPPRPSQLKPDRQNNREAGSPPPDFSQLLGDPVSVETITHYRTTTTTIRNVHSPQSAQKSHANKTKEHMTHATAHIPAFEPPPHLSHQRSDQGEHGFLPKLDGRSNVHTATSTCPA